MKVENAKKQTNDAMKSVSALSNSMSEADALISELRNKEITQEAEKRANMEVSKFNNYKE
jgi:hypothetical protein